MEKGINIKVHEDVWKVAKIKATEEDLTLKDYIVNLIIKDQVKDKIEFTGEELTMLNISLDLKKASVKSNVKHLKNKIEERETTKQTAIGKKALEQEKNLLKYQLEDLETLQNLQNKINKL